MARFNVNENKLKVYFHVKFVKTMLKSIGSFVLNVETM